MGVHRESTLVAAPCHSVWAMLRDPGQWDAWLSGCGLAVARGGGVGASWVTADIRLDLGPDLTLVMSRLALSDHHGTVTAVILQPEALAGVVMRLGVQPVTMTGHCFVDWTVDFRPGHAPGALRNRVVTQLMRAGLQGLAVLRGAPVATTGHAHGLADSRSGGPMPHPPQPNPPRPEPPQPAPPQPEPPRPRPPLPVAGRPPAAGPRAIMARAMGATRHGGPEVLTLSARSVPPPATGQVRLRLHYSGVNVIDLACLAGTTRMLPLPGVPGIEGVGTVESLGAQVPGLQPGDRVGHIGPPLGSYSTHQTVPWQHLIPLPDAVSDQMAAALLLKGMMASVLLHDVHRLRSGETVLVLSAAGGVGQALVQWAAALGARVIAVVSGPEKAALLAGLGVAEVIDRQAVGLANAALDLTDGKGADLVLDGVGRATLAESLRATALCGHLVSFGAASGPVDTLPMAGLGARSLTVSRPNLGHYIATREARLRVAARLFDAVSGALIKPAAPLVLPLQDAARALQDVASGQGAQVRILDCAPADQPAHQPVHQPAQGEPG